MSASLTPSGSAPVSPQVGGPPIGSPANPPGDEGLPGPDWRDGWARLLLVLALALGLLRFLRLGEWSLWIDEALTLSDALHAEPLRNPLGYALIGAFAGLFEERPDERTLRLLPAVFGWLCVPAAAFCLRPVVGSRTAAGAALLLAVSSWHVYWSQTARFYTLAMLLTLLGGALVLDGLRRDRPGRVFVGLAGVGAGALAHPTALLVAPGLLLAALLPRGWHVRGALGGRRATAVVAALALAVGILAAGWAWDVLESWWRARGTEFSTPHFVLTTGFFMTPLVGTAAIFGLFLAIAGRDRGVVASACVLVGGLGAALVLSTVARMTAQYVFVLLPWLLVLAAAPLGGAASAVARGNPAEGAPRRGPRPGGALAAGYLAVLVVPSLVSCALYLTVRHGERPRWRDAFALVFEQRRQGDLIFSMAAPVAEYYLAERNTYVREPREVVYLDRWLAEVPGLWDRRDRRAWFVLNPEEMADWEPAQRAEVQRLLRENCRLVAYFPLYVESRDLSVKVYLRD